MIEFDGTIIVQIINFAIFLFIMRVIIFNPLISQIEDRRNYISSNQNKIKDSLAKLEENEKENKNMIIQARKKAQEIIDNSVKIAEESKSKLINEALEENKKSFDEFKSNLDKEIKETKALLDGEINNIAGEIANKVIKFDNNKVSA